MTGNISLGIPSGPLVLEIPSCPILFVGNTGVCLIVNYVVLSLPRSSASAMKYTSSIHVFLTMSTRKNV